MRPTSHSPSRRPGYTLVEAILALGILSLIAGGAVLFPGAFQPGQTLDAVTRGLLYSDLRAVQQRSQTRERGFKDWGIAFRETDYVLFPGTNFSDGARPTTYDEVRTLPSGVRFSGLAQVTYQNGIAQTSGTLTVTHAPSGRTRTIPFTAGNLDIGAPIAGPPGTASSAASGAAPDGTPDNPYLVLNCDQLRAIGNDMTAHYRLTADINCDVYPYSADVPSLFGFPPLRDAFPYYPPPYEWYFRGSLDGGGHSIFGLYSKTFNINNSKGVGLFYGLSGSTVQNLHIVNARITGSAKEGGGILAGTGTNATIRNVTVSGVLTVDHVPGLMAPARPFGCLIGVTSNGVVEDVESDCTIVTTYSSVLDAPFGGFIGSSDGTAIRRAGARGDVAVNAECAGGIVGENIGGAIEDSYATGNVRGAACVGGLAGFNSGQIHRSYAAGTVTTSSPGAAAGGLVGTQSPDAVVSASYYDSQTTGLTGAPGTPRTTAQMMQQATFPTWDFSSIWEIAEGVGYPTLR